MVERQANYKKFVGNVCLHSNLGVGRRFLRRNLNHILDIHEKLVHQTSNDALRRDMIANEKRTSGWDFPTREMLDDLMRGQKPLLQVDSLQIRHPQSKARIKKRYERQSRNEDDLDWLPQPGAGLRMPCQVGITVSDTRTSKSRIYVDTRPGTIVQESEELYPHFNIELDRPFLVELEKLFVVTDTGSNGYRHWKKTVTAKYVLEITIQCQDGDDTSELLSRVEGRDVSSYDNAPGNEGVLKATWENLPECPPEGFLMILRRAKGHKSIEPDYKLEVSMGWARKHDSPLARYNKRFMEMHGSSQQLPTPSASDDLDKTPMSYAITYNFQDGQMTRSTTVEGLFCPLCRNHGEHSSFERLQLHCMLYHDHFKFENEDMEVRRGSSTIRKVVWISLAESPHERERVNGPDTPSCWVAPRRPFSISAHVRGEDDWTGHGKAKTGAKRGRPAKDKERDSGPSYAPQPVRKRPAPEEVEDLPDPTPKRRQVPNVPDVNFYHTTSKQLLNPGEYLAESEDEVDEPWLAQKEERALEELGITGVAKEFTKTFNEHLAREQSNSIILTREAMVRFTRIHHTALQDVEWQRHFRAKLNQLRDAGIVSDEFVLHCVRGLKAAADVNGSTEDDTVGGANVVANGVKDCEHAFTDQRPRKVWSRGKFVSRGAAEPPNSETTLPNGDALQLPQGPSRSTPTTQNGELGAGTTGTDSAEPSAQRSAVKKPVRMHVCICDISAKDARGGIACADPSCNRKDYHLACVGLERRLHAWRCSDCSY